MGSKDLFILFRETLRSWIKSNFTLETRFLRTEAHSPKKDNNFYRTYFQDYLNWKISRVERDRSEK